VDAYPGDSATPAELLRLAGEYRASARHLLPLGRKGDLLSRAPCRLVALHSIELYLNSYLLMAGMDRKALRGMQHNLSERATQAKSAGLSLRKRTFAHLVDLSANREYLVTRYGPEMTTTLSQLNRLMATVDELAKKVVAVDEP
jgi:hypothetical protein